MTEHYNGVSRRKVVRDAGRGGWGWGEALWDEGFSRIDQALEEADCATFEDAGTITLLGSRLASRRKPNNERKRALIFAQEVRLRLLPG